MRILFLALCLFAANTASAYPDSELIKIADVVNQSAPKMIDEATQLLRASGGNNTLHYYYKMVNHAASDFDIKKFEQLQREDLLSKICDTINPMLNAGILVVFNYEGKNGGHIATVPITRNDCS